MSLYSILAGEEPLADILLAGLGLTRSDVGRFRDAWVTTEGEIAVYTRNGGGNRDCWSDEDESTESCECPGCIITYRLPKHPLYLRDSDDDFDSTYATIHFKPPDAIPEDFPRGVSGDERWAAILAKLHGGQP